MALVHQVISNSYTMRLWPSMIDCRYMSILLYCYAYHRLQYGIVNVCIAPPIGNISITRGLKVAYSDILSPEVLEPAIWKSLVAMEGQAALLVPVALENGGNLRDSITIKTESNEKQHGSSPDGLTYKPTAYGGVIGSAAEYAAAVEFGRPDIPAYPAQPYLRPALDWFRAKVGQITGKELKSQMDLYSIRHPYKVKEYIMGGNK